MYSCLKPFYENYYFRELVSHYNLTFVQNFKLDMEIIFLIKKDGQTLNETEFKHDRFF